MPVAYSIDSAAGVIHTVCQPPFRFEEVIEHFQTLHRDPAFRGDLDVLLDVTNADFLPETSQLSNITVGVGALTQKVNFGACAIIAGRDAMFGMMRIFETFAAEHFRAIHVFRDPREAELWLISERNRIAAADAPSKNGL